MYTAMISCVYWIVYVAVNTQWNTVLKKDALHSFKDTQFSTEAELLPTELHHYVVKGDATVPRLDPVFL